jgi:tocopherol cyclase
MRRGLWNEYYKGSGRMRRYFEGWYFKQVSADRSEIWSFIPGISRGENRGEGYAFVQVIEGRSGRTWWFEYAAHEFSASRDGLDIRVGGNHFTEGGIVLDLAGPEGNFHGELRFGAFTRLPSSLLWPGVMGPYSFVPFMECKHGLLSLHHSVVGGFETEGRAVNLGGPEGLGRGYIEKDWGSSMPSRWIWMQSNNFEAEGDSFMLSIADIPWLGSSFTGFLCVGSIGGRILREASYTGARLADFSLEDGSVKLALRRAGLRLEIEASRSRGGLLRAPVRGLLTRRISESVDACLRLRWLDGGKLLFEGEAPAAGLELVGDPRLLFGRVPAAQATRLQAEPR